MARCRTTVCLAMMLVNVQICAGEDATPTYRPADTSSPRATLKSFITSCNELHRRIVTENYFDRTSPDCRSLSRQIVDCLDVSELPAYAREQLAGEVAVCLKEVLDRVEVPPENEIPNSAAIKEDDAKEDGYRWRIPGTRITIGRVEEGARRDEYLFTRDTVERSVEYYEELVDMPYRTTGPQVSNGLYQWYFSAPGHPWVAALVKKLPDWTRERTFGLTVWKWPGILVSLVISIVLMVAAYRLQSRFSTTRKGLLRYWLSIGFSIAAILVPIWFKHVVEYVLTVRGAPLYSISFAANVTAFLAVMVVIIGIGNRVAETIITSPKIHPRGLDAQFIRILSRLLTLVAVTIVFLEGGRYLGIPITTLLTGAGIGGLAVALAAQSTLKDLLGTMMILLDKPYRVGERIILRSYDGFVDEIGLRSTKIRLLSGHMASVPNDLMAQSEIENVGRRPHIRRISDIHIPLDTPREKVEQAIALVRLALNAHEGMDPDFPPRVYFNEFNSDSFNIRVIYWYNPPNYWEFLAHSEKVNVEILRAFEAHGIQFTLPLRMTGRLNDTSVQRSE